jgi:hypothetical protein
VIDYFNDGKGEGDKEVRCGVGYGVGYGDADGCGWVYGNSYGAGGCPGQGDDFGNGCGYDISRRMLSDITGGGNDYGSDFCCGRASGYGYDGCDELAYE